ncbi:MAG: hypothetical protein J6X55_11025 [Victivallales bacterium]|nr:hypothetical protein [Victivallales bacterium]
MNLGKGIIVAALVSLTAFAALINDADSVRLSKDGITVSQGDDVLLMSDDFAKPSDKWILPHKIFEDFTWIHHDQTAGIPTLRIERNPKRVPPEKRLFDTAWQLTTVPIALPANTIRINLSTKVFSNNPEMVNAAGHGNGYKNSVAWFKDNGKTALKEDGFFFNVAESFPAETFLEFDVPKGADTVQIFLGADTPDLLPKEFVAMAGLKLAAIQQNSRFKHNASFTTNACRIDGPVTWKATVPDGTSLSLQASVASEVNSLPGTWSDYKTISQGQSPAELAPNAKWVKFKILMTATDSAAPTLQAIQVGNRRLADWSKDTDTIPPRTSRVSQSPTEDTKQPYIFSVFDENPVQWNNFTIKVDDAEMPFTRQDDVVTIPAPAEGWKPGVHIVSFTLADILGNSITEDLAFYIGKIRTTNIVTMRDDGMALIDGKPFFPIGMACAVKCDHNDNDFDKLFAMFEEAGMNFARHFSGFSLRSGIAMEYINAAEKHGVKLYIAGGRGANDCNIKSLAENIAFQMHLPNVAWDTGDDTANHIKPEQMRQRYNAIKAVDPYRITTQADPLGPFSNTRYRPYALYSDNFSPEIYPVHNDSEQDKNQIVPTVISTMKAIHKDVQAVNAPTRSCWPLIQYFYNCGNWKRLQTFEELRCMTYQAIIHGAQGIIWYRYAGYNENLKTGFTPEQWNVVVRTSKELRKLYDVLCQRAAAVQPAEPEILEGPQTDVWGNHSISVLLKEGDATSRILFAASSVRKPVKARITIPSGATSVVDFFDGHACTPDANGVIEDTFNPLGVHVYVVK